MSSTGKLVITIYILPNESRSKGNQALDLCQLIENNIRNIFLENHMQNVVVQLVPDSFQKIQN